MIILGVESSCDETGVGIIRLQEDGTPEVLANVVASSMEQHARFGGVVPEIASRAHMEAIVPVMREALAQAQISKPDVVAATVGPGLAGALLVGAAAAKAYAAAWQVPFYGINHLGGHVAVADLDQTEPLDNAVALLVSGGHTELLHVKDGGLSEIGATVDDAAGEAYDKVARLLRLGYPGGPIIDRLAATGKKNAIAFPRPLMQKGYDFSFSGLKTAVARYVEAAEAAGEVIDLPDVCASFQEAVCDVLTAKAVKACAEYGATTLLLGGGVSANSRLRQLAADRCRSKGITLKVPPLKYCTDNGIMIAALAAKLLRDNPELTPSSWDSETDPVLPAEVLQVQ